MKKLLALVLALVMTLGLATVSSSAAYSDKADIEYTEAADVMTALGVFQGKGDAFAPKDNLNRAEAAKLIAYLMLGNKTAESMIGSGTRFTDVPASHWAAGFIEYLASVGIVSGVGNNQFNPNGQVTAVQFAKMLLVALGYDADLEGFVGEGWSINIQKLANKNDLFETLEVGTNDALTREQAAQMCLNDLKADMVKYSDKGTTVKIGESTVVTGAKEAAKDEDVGNKNYNNSKDANGDKKYLQLAESLYGNDIKLDEGQDDFGRPTNTWNYKNIKVGEYADNAQLIATATEKFSRKSLYDALGKDQYDNIKDGKTFLYVYEDGKGGKVDASKADNYMDRNDTSKISNTGNGSLTQVYLNDNGSNDVVRVVTTHTYVWQVTNDYSASRGDITIKQVGESGNKGQTVGATTLPNDHIITLKDKTLKDDDFEAVKGLKKDDYVLITAYTNRAGTASYEVDSIAKAELKSGKVDSFTKSDTVTIDGTKTKYSNMAPENDEQKGATYTVGEEARFVMDKYGYVIAVDELVVNNNYVFVANIASTGGLNTNPEGDAYFTDGTNEAIRINKVGTDDGKKAILGDDVTPESIQNIGAFSNSTRDAVSSNAGWYTYSKASNGKYNLNKLSSSYLQVGYVYDAANGNLTDVVSNDKVNFLATRSGNAKQITTGLAELYKTGVNASSLRANDKTIFVVEQDGDVNVYTGLKNAPNVSLAKANSDKAVIVVAYDKGNSYAKYVYITLTPKAEVDGGQNTALFYVLKRDTEDVVTDQKDYEMWYVIDENGKDVLVKTDTKFMNANKLYRAYYKTFKNSSDEYTKVTPITDSSNNIAAANSNKHYIEAIGLTSSANGDANDITFNNGSLFVGNVGFTTTSDTKIILVIQGDGAADMKVNTDKNYEIENYTGNGDGLEQKFNDYSTYTYDVQGRIGGTYPGDTDLKEIYITVTAANKIGAAAASGTLTPSVTATHLSSIAITDTTKGTSLSTSTATAVAAGDTITVTATPDSGYKLSVSVKDSSNAAVALTKITNGYSFTMPASGKSVTVTVKASDSSVVEDANKFASINNETITVVTNQTRIPVTVTRPAYVPSGAKLTIDGDVSVNGTLYGKLSAVVTTGQNVITSAAINPLSTVMLFDTAKLAVPNDTEVTIDNLTATWNKVSVNYYLGSVADANKVTSAITGLTEMKTDGTDTLDFYFTTTADFVGDESANFTVQNATLATGAAISSAAMTGVDASGATWAGIATVKASGTDYVNVVFSNVTKTPVAWAMKYQAKTGASTLGTATPFTASDGATSPSHMVDMGDVAWYGASTATRTNDNIVLGAMAATVSSAAENKKVTLLVGTSADGAATTAAALAMGDKPLQVVITDGTNDYTVILPNDGATKFKTVTANVSGDTTFKVKSVTVITSLPTLVSAVIQDEADAVGVYNKLSKNDKLILTFDRDMSATGTNATGLVTGLTATSVTLGGTAVWSDDGKTVTLTIASVAGAAADVVVTDNFKDANGLRMNNGKSTAGTWKFGNSLAADADISTAASRTLDITAKS